MDVTVCIGTFGDSSWEHLARTRAIPSAAEQAPVIHEHRDTLHEARNAALEKVETDWVCHLDADDELEPGFMAHMAQAEADLLVPSVRYVLDRPRQAIMPKVHGHRHQCSAECLPQGNWIVIGAVVMTDLVKRVGGWRDFAWSEDWDLWLRCWKEGASIEPVPEAVYRAHVRADSRNRAPDHDFKLSVHEAIYRANFSNGRKAA